MSAIAIIILVLLVVVAFVLLAIGLGLPILNNNGQIGKGAMQSNLRNMVSVQRTMSQSTRAKDGTNQREKLTEAAAMAKVKKIGNSKLTLEKKLRYSQWPIKPVIFRSFVFLSAFLFFLIAQIWFGIVLQVVGVIMGPLLMNGLLNRSLHNRFVAFDKDYVPFLLSLVGLLKTGMNPLNAISSASEGLEDGSLVKLEIDMMLERLRLGVPEEQSIGSFGEDICHPEIELFVEALLLSRRVGGNLSETLERLASQIRVRQFFRHSANSAVGLQRASIWVIILVLVFIMGYLYITSPNMINAAIDSEVGWQIWQGGIFLILLGIYLVRQVTKIRI